MEVELATVYDVIVVGTGFVESVVAAAAARIGKKVLHIDKNDYYGGQWASFTLQGMQQWVKEVTATPQPHTGEVKAESGESLVAVGDANLAYFNVKQVWHIPEDVPVTRDSQEATSPPLESALGSTINTTTTEAKLEATEKTTSTVTDAVKSLTIDTSPTATEEVSETTVEISKATAGETEDADTGSPESQCTQNTIELSPGASDSVARPDTTVEEKTWSRGELLKVSRKFNLDLAPKLLYSRGPMVELLISSNVARYTEFKCITRVLTWVASKGGTKDVDKGSEDSDKGGSLVGVPCSRSDVFTSSAISLVEKRLLMKFLQFCKDYDKNQDQLKEYENKSFDEFLLSRRLTGPLSHFVQEAMAMVGPGEQCRVGLERTRLFLTSLGRYGTTPFLFSMYGCGELPQAFCRLCAVFEGTYVLRKPVSHLILDTEGKRCQGLVSEGQRFTCDHLVMTAPLAPPHYLTKDGSLASLPNLSRAIIITDRSMIAHEKDQLTLLRVPAAPDGPQPVTVVEVGQGSGVCPESLNCLQLTCKGSGAEVDLAGAVGRVLGSPAGPAPLWSLHYNQADLSGCDLVSQCPAGLHLCPGPDASLDYDAAITQAQDIFSRMFPEETFLPRAPDPDEIVFDNAGAEPGQDDALGEVGGGESEEGKEKSEQEGKNIKSEKVFESEGSKVKPEDELEKTESMSDEGS